MIARSYWPTYGLPVAVTRFANIYGGGDLNFSRLIPEAVSAVLDGRRAGDPLRRQPERDFLYVEDAVAAYLAIARGARRRPAAAARRSTPAASSPHSVARWSSLICAARAADIEPDYPRRRQPGGEIDRQYVDSTKLRRAHRLAPEVELREGLAATLDWYREHPEIRPVASI